MSMKRIADHEYIEVPCIEVVQPVGTFYIAAVGYKDLLDISYADVRRLKTNSTELEEYIGIQRLLSPSRVKEIANYVKLVDATFPTGVIIQVPEFATQTNEQGDQEIVTVIPEGEDPIQLRNVMYDRESKTLSIRKNENVAKILDGQHRLEGLKEGATEELENDKFQLNVTIFVEMDMEDQAIVFATINKTQSKVNKSLVADLFEYTKARSPQKTAHNIVRALDQKEGSPFHRKINILGKAEDEMETITQATFVDWLLKYISGNNLRAMRDRDAYKRGDVPEKATGAETKRVFLRNMFIDERDADIAQIIWNYFAVVSEKWPEAWTDPQRGLILNRSTGFIALMRFLKHAYLSFDALDTVITKEQFRTVFDAIDLTSDGFTRESYLPGSSGQKKLYDELVEKSGLGNPPA